ncbi:hypothetical protein SLS54_010401 [Diplodia seriata]
MLPILTGIRHPSLRRSEAKDKRRLEAWRDGFDDTLTTFRGRLVPLHGTHLHYNKPREYWLLPAGSWEVIKIKAKLKRPTKSRSPGRSQLLIKRKRRYEPDTTWFERMAKRQAADMLKPVSQRAGAAAAPSSRQITLYRALDAQLHADAGHDAAGTAQHCVDIGQTFFPWPRLPARLQARVLAFAWWGDNIDHDKPAALRLEWLAHRNRFQAVPLRDQYRQTARRRSLYHPSSSPPAGTTTTTPLPTLLTVNRAFSARVLHAFHSLTTLHFSAAADLVRFLETRDCEADHLGQLAHLVLATTDRDAFEALTPRRAFGTVISGSSARRRRGRRGRGLGMLREGEVEEEEEEEEEESWEDSDSDGSGDSDSNSSNSSCEVEDDYSGTDTGSSFLAESESSGHKRRRRRGGRQYRQEKKKENKKRRSKSKHHGHHDHEHHGGDCCDHDHEHAHDHEHDDFSIGATTEETQWRPAWLHWPKKPALLTRFNLAKAKKKVKKATMALRPFGRKAKGKDNKKKGSDHDCRRSHGHHHHHHKHANHSHSHGNKKNRVGDSVVLPPINLRRRRSLQNGSSSTPPKDVLTGLKTFVLKSRAANTTILANQTDPDGPGTSNGCASWKSGRSGVRSVVPLLLPLPYHTHHHPSPAAAAAAVNININNPDCRRPTMMVTADASFAT